MRRISLSNILLLLLIYQGATSSVFASQPHITGAAVIVNAYFNAQMGGDIATIKSILCGQLLDKRNRLLDNPTYPAHLVDAYAGAQFTINHHHAMGDSQAVVDATVLFPGGEVSQRQFFLKKTTNAINTTGSYCIYSESIK